MRTLRCAVTILVIGAAATAQIAVVPPFVPPGFAVDILTENISEPTGLAFLPDGRVLITEQRTGAVKVWAGGGPVGTLGIVPGVNSTGFERGLLAVAVDPQWPARPYVYVWFNSASTPNMRLAMFTVTGDLAIPSSTNLSLGAQYDIRTDVPDATSIHNGGSLRFGPDGMLYLSIGDDANACAAQDINSSLGCIVRMNVSSLPGPGAGPPPKSVLIPPGNPFSGPTDNARLVWCYGLRNPFRFHVDSPTGIIHIAEVGAWLVDELDVSVSGGENFGWPWFEANLFGMPCSGATPPTVHPITSLPHWTLWASVTAIMSCGRYRNAPNGAYNFGVNYEGDYFFSEYFSGLLRRLRFNGNAWVPAPPVPGQANSTDWGGGFQSVVDTALGPDGAIYFVKQYSVHQGALGRIRADPNGSVLTRVSGNNQPGNAGLPLQHPLVVGVTTPAGTPIAGATVTFLPVAGGGSVNPPTATTDAQGLASTTYTLASSYTAAPVVAATVSGTSYVAFDVVWRGISVAYAPPPFGYFTTEVRHSETNSGFTLAWQRPPAAPYGSTPYGDIWTDITSPMAVAGYADGLGLFGAPDPQFRTAYASPYWSVTVPGPTFLGGITLLFQAYAIDTSLFPAPESIMISNTQIVTIP